MFKKNLVYFFIILSVFYAVYYSFNQLNQIKSNLINFNYLYFIFIFLFIDFFLYTLFLKNFLNNDKFYKLLFIIYLPFIFLFLTKFFYFSIKFPIREFRVELKAVKYLYLLIFSSFIFLKVLYLIYLLKINKIFLFRKFLIFLFALYVFINFSLIEYFQYARGDEIEYYLVLNSIINDFDFNIVNDVHYSELLCNSNILPVIIIEKPNLLLTQHCSSILFYIFFILPYLIAERFGVLIFLNFLFAFAFLLLFSYFENYLQKKYLLFFILLFPPFTIYSTKFYPEIFPIFYIFLFFIFFKKIDKKFFLFSIFLNSLMLFNIRFLIISFFSSITIILKIEKIKNKIIFLLGFFLILFIYLFLNLLIYGDFSIAANTGGKEISYLKLNNFQILNALLFDQEFGVLIYNPLFLFIINAIILGLKKFEYKNVIIVILFYLFFLSFYADNWWGGISPPFRFLLFSVILFYPLIFIIYEKLKNFNFFKILFLFLFFITLLFSFLIISFPAFQYNDRFNGQNQILEKIDWVLKTNFVNFFPSYIKNQNLKMQYLYWLLILILTITINSLFNKVIQKN